MWRRPYDLLLLAYFVSHIPITALLDAQSILPRASFPRWAVAAMDWHIQVNSDHLVGAPVVTGPHFQTVR